MHLRAAPALPSHVISIGMLTLLGISRLCTLHVFSAASHSFSCLPLPSEVNEHIVYRSCPPYGMFRALFNFTCTGVLGVYTRNCTKLGVAPNK